MSEDWRTAARRALHLLRAGPGRWAYRAGAAPAVEPTVLAGLGLLAGAPDADERATIRAAADWLATLQRPDGALGVTDRLTTPGWTTPYALLLWQALASHAPERQRALAWLLRTRGGTTPPSADPDHIVGHDTMLVGWPWVEGTHSWVEPTALAVLALRRAGLCGHPRVRDGLRVLGDRALVTGGWNCGNKAAFGRVLRPLPAPTGLALLALAGADAPANLMNLALDYLNKTLPEARAAHSLGWGVLGLRAWDRAPAETEAWLADSCRRVLDRPDAAPRLACLLLAGGGQALPLLIGPGTEDRNG